MLNKHKLFLLCAKWIPVVTAIGILVTNTIAYQRNILFNDKNYISIDTQLKILVQEALVNSVKNVIENSEIGNKLLTQQLNLIKTNKDKIIAESNRELETFKKFQIAAQANPNLTYKEFCENINNK